MSLESQQAQAGKPNQATRRVMVGSVPMGGGAPVVVQSMLNAPADDAGGQPGADRARWPRPAARSCAWPSRAARAWTRSEAVCEASPLPVVADIHFDARIAIEAARRGAAKLRINPGNIGGLGARPTRCSTRRGEAGHPHPHRRERRVARPRAGSPRATTCRCRDKLALSARGVRAPLARTAASTTWCVSRQGPRRDGDGAPRTACSRASCPRCRCTSASPRRARAFQGIIKSACGAGHPAGGGHRRHAAHLAHRRSGRRRCRACWTLLAALDLRRRTPELISCPTCGRCQVDLIGLAQAGRASASRRMAQARSRWPSWGAWSTVPGEAARRRHRRGLRRRASGVVFAQGKTVAARSTRPTSWTL